MTTTLHRLQYYTIYVKLYACVLRVYNIPTTSLFGRQASALQTKANEDLHWDLMIKLTHNDFGPWTLLAHAAVVFCGLLLMTILYPKTKSLQKLQTMPTKPQRTAIAPRRVQCSTKGFSGFIFPFYKVQTRLHDI